MLSGIGPADHLMSVGIRPLHDLPGVGANLQDHLDVSLLQFCKTRDTYDRANKLWALYQYVANKKGPGTSPIAESGGFLRTRPELSAPDIQLHFLPVLVVDHGRTQMKRNGYSLHVCTLRPESRGTIRLKSSDPGEHPLIDADSTWPSGATSTPLMAGLKIGREIFAGSASIPTATPSSSPEPAVKTDAEIEQWVRGHLRDDLSPGRQLQDGARNDPMAVVDHRCRVRGLVGLRVVDASVMPTLIGGNTNAPTIMIAERVAAFMQEP